MAGNESAEAWLAETVSKVVRSIGAPLEGMQYEMTKSVACCMSKLYYVCVKYKETVMAHRNELLVILKKPMQSNATIMSLQCAFHNEALFYTVYAQPDENFPRCFLCSDSTDEDSFVIALENMNPRGYYPCLFSYNAPMDYTVLVMREIALFHAKGYILKERQPKEFFNIVQQIQETRYDTKSHTGSFFKCIFNITSTRAVEYLRSHGYDEFFCDKLEALFSNAFEKVMVKTARFTGPLATICHGDLTLDNVLFCMKGDGQQQRAMLIDFALLRYSTPVVDLSTYICLCCSNEMVRNNFYDIISVYHKTLTRCLLQAGLDVEKYSLDAFLSDYRKGSLFGFLIASFYIPKLMGCCEELVFSDLKTSAEKRKSSGGDKISKILADMLINLHDLGCLSHVL